MRHGDFFFSKRAIRYAALRRRHSSAISTSAENVGITDTDVQLLLRAHGKALLRKNDLHFQPPLIAQRVPAAEISLQSVLDFRESQSQELQQRQQQERQQKDAKKKQEESKGLDLAIFLGSLKPIPGETSAKKSARWEKIQEKVARRRPPVRVEQSQCSQNLEQEKREEIVEVAQVLKRVDLEVPNLNFGEDLFPEKKADYDRSKLSKFLERLKRDKALAVVSHGAEDKQRCATENPTRRVWTGGSLSTGFDLIDQEAFNAMQSLDGADDVHESSISGRSFSVLIRSFSAPEALEGSIKVLEATKELGFLPSTTVQSLLVCLSLKAGQHDKAKQMLGEFFLEGSKAKAGVILTLTDAFERAGNLRAVHTLFLGMLQSMVRVNAGTTERFFSALLRSGRIDETYALYQEHGITGSAIKVQTCNFLMDCLGKAGRHGDAAKILSRMRKQPQVCTPNISSYNIVIKNLTRDLEMTKAFRIFRMLERDNVTPDVGSYHYIIAGLCKLQKKKMARMYFKSMKRSGLQPDPMTCSCLIDCYGRRNEIKGALKLFEEMKRTNIPLDTRVFNSLLRAVGKSYKPSMVYNIFREMKYFGKVPDIWTYNLLFYGLSRRGRRKRARAAFREMHRDRVQPDIYTYTAIILCLGNAGRTKSAYNLMQNLLRRGIEVNLRTWNALLRGLTKDDVIDVAFSVYKDMRARGFEPDNTTYSLLLEVSMSLRDTKRVFQIQRDYKDSRLEPDIPMQKLLQRSIRYMSKDRRTPFDPQVLLKS